MKKLASFCFLFSCVLSSYGETNLPSKVIWGKYCGECVGECSTMRQISKIQLSIDRTNNYLKSDPQKFKYEFNGVSEPSNEFEKYKWILSVPVPYILSKGTQVFGQPDAYDQCGYYLMYSVNSIEYKALIDTRKVPNELEPIIKRLFGGKL